MQNFSRFTMTAAFLGAFVLSGLFASPAVSHASNAEKISAVGVPVLQMKHWARSSQDEKLAFLFGFASLLELEKEWQGAKPLPLNQSIVGSWVRGLDGVTLGQMARALDKYAKENPDDLSRPVVEVMGITYVRPKLSEAELARAAKKVDQIKR